MNFSTTVTFGKRIRQSLIRRLPNLQSMMQVFAVVSLAFYGWTFVSMAWQLNSWLRNLNLWEIISLVAYLMLFSFLEAALALVGLLGLTLVLPAKILKERFVVRGTIIAVCVVSSIMLHLKLFEGGTRAALVQSLELWWLLTFAITTGLAWSLPNLPAGTKLIQEFADRATVFLYIFLPLTAFATLLILFRIISAA